MKKKILLYALIGAPVGVTVGTVITILISLTAGDGNFYPVVPSLIEKCGNELNAVIVQTVCLLIYGAVWAAASLIWRMDEWSITRQTITHLIICSGTTFPVAYFMYWMEHSVWGILSYFGIFLGIYLVIWLSLYLSIKRKIRQINTRFRNSASSDLS